MHINKFIKGLINIEIFDKIIINYFGGKNERIRKQK